MSESQSSNITFAEYEIDRAHRQLFRAGEHVPLYAKTFDLLDFLVEKNGDLVTKDEILEAVWPGQFVEESNLSVQISALRKALGEKRDAPRFLITIPGKGYKFVADVLSGSDDIVIEKHQVSRFVVEEELDSENFVAPRPIALLPVHHWPKIALGTGVLLLAIVTIGVWFLYRTRENRATAIPAADPKVKRLTNQGRINRVDLSPDGKFFAYTVRPRGTYDTELHLGQTDGSSDVLLRSIPGLSQYPIGFSSDSQYLYFVEIPPVIEYNHSKGALYKMPVLRGIPQKLNDSGSVFSVLSPDEKQVAFPRGNSQNNTSTIVISDLNGDNQHEIVARPAHQGIDGESLAWSADGRVIAFSAATGISRKDASRRTYEVFVASLADGAVEQLTSANWHDAGTLEWLKDGTGLLATGRSNEQINSSSLWLIDYPGGKVQRFSRDVNRYAWVSGMSADSRSFTAVQLESQTNLFVAPGDDLSEAKQITHSSSGRQDGWYGVDWTPDGRLVYAAWIDESLTLWIANADGSNATQLTSIGFRDERPAVTSDGKHIVFESNRSGDKEIWRLDIDGQNAKQLTAGGGNSHPSVTPDGVWVVFRHSKPGDGSLLRVPLEGGEPFTITDLDVNVPRVSPDGRFVAAGAPLDKKTKLAIFPIDGGEPLKVFGIPDSTNFRYSIRWSPDGDSILYPDAVNGIWRQDIAGGVPTKIKGLPSEGIFAFAWSRDGKQFAFGRQREERDVVLISNFR